MSGWDGAPGPRRRVRWKTPAKYLLAFTGVFLLLWAIWNPDNRVQWVLTGLLALATWGVWLRLDRDEPQNRDPVDPTLGPDAGGRGTPVRSPGTESPRDRRDRQH